MTHGSIDFLFSHYIRHGRLPISTQENNNSMVIFDQAYEWMDVHDM